MADVWERAGYSVYYACLSSTFINFCIFFFPFRFGELDIGFDCIHS